MSEMYLRANGKVFRVDGECSMDLRSEPDWINVTTLQDYDEGLPNKYAKGFSTEVLEVSLHLWEGDHLWLLLVDEIEVGVRFNDNRHWVTMKGRMTSCGPFGFTVDVHSKESSLP